MDTKDPKYAIIERLTDADSRMKREERGMLAKPESISFLKEKNYLCAYTYVVRYISTTNQQWYSTNYLIQNKDGSFPYRSEVSCKAEDRFLADKGTQPHLIVSTGGGKLPGQTRVQGESLREIQEVVEGKVTKHTLRIGSQSIHFDPAGDVSGYRYLVGYLTTQGQNIASVRMIPHVGPVEEDKVQDNTVLFLSKYSSPITFEFYSPSHALVATQLWDV
jgi:hypothetical protein